MVIADTPSTLNISTHFMNRYLIKQRASVAAVNSEGELPSDIAQGEAMEKMLKEVIKKQGKNSMEMGITLVGRYCFTIKDLKSFIKL